MTVERFDDLREFVGHVYGFMQGAVVAGMIYLGDKMGLYRAMHGAGPVTPAGLAATTRLDERWLAEWLRGQAAAGLLAYRGNDRFELTDAAAMVLADEEGSIAFSAGAFSGLPARMRILERLPEAFRTGVGLPYDAAGPEGSHATSRMFAPWFRHLLIPVILPGLDGVVDKLREGALVADVGCGAGVALVEMAKAFPESRFRGYDISRHGLELAGQAVAEAGLDNVELHLAKAEHLPASGDLDLVTAFDCIHDMTDPLGALRAAHRALASDGTLLIADIKGKPSFEENLASANPMLAMMYGMSVMSCLSSALSEPGGAGLGTLGFHEQVARDMTRQAGFTRFAAHDFGHPVNTYYEVRP